MDDQPKPPLVFANRVIRQFVDHLVGPDVIIEPRDYQILRLIFRKLGGNWWDLIHGSIAQATLIEQVVVNWGQRPDRKREKEDDV